MNVKTFKSATHKNRKKTAQSQLVENIIVNYMAGYVFFNIFVVDVSAFVGFLKVGCSN